MEISQGKGAWYLATSLMIIYESFLCVQSPPPEFEKFKPKDDNDFAIPAEIELEAD